MSKSLLWIENKGKTVKENFFYIGHRKQWTRMDISWINKNGINLY